MSTKNIKLNYIYNLIYQIFLIIVPIFLTPFLARSLGVDASGQYSFSSSILNYFTPLAALGYGYYGQRAIAKEKDNRAQSIIFWEVFLGKGVFTTLTIIVYLGIVLAGIFDAKYQSLLLIQVINLVSIYFDITFFYQGKEEFNKIVLKNVIIKIISIALIFIFVRSPESVRIYALILGLTTIISNLSLWLYLWRDVEKVSVRELHPAKHIIPTLILFLPTVASTLYSSINKTMIGLLTNSDFENGNFEYADKLVNMAITILTSLGTIMVSRNSNLIAEKKLADVDYNLNKSCQFIFFAGLPMCLGLICISYNFLPWYLGSEYTLAPKILILLSPVILFMGISNVLGMQFLIPTKQDSKFAFAIVSGTVINLVLNFPLIIYYGSLGAGISTLISQLYICILIIVFLRKHLNFKLIFKLSRKYMISSILLFIVCFIESYFLTPSFVNTLLIIFSGIAVYSLLLVVLKDQLVISNLKAIFNFVKRRLKSR